MKDTSGWEPNVPNLEKPNSPDLRVSHCRKDVLRVQPTTDQSSLATQLTKAFVEPCARNIWTMKMQKQTIYFLSGVVTTNEPTWA